MFDGESLGIPTDMQSSPLLRAMYQLARRRQQQGPGPADPMAPDQPIDYSDPQTADIIDTVNPRVKDTPSDAAYAASTATPPAPTAPAQPINSAPDALSSAIGASPSPGSAVTGTSDRLKTLEDQYDSRFGANRPKGFMNTVLPGLARMAPVIGLALAGKGRAAAGLGMGLAGAEKTQMDRTMQDRGVLMHQIEDERNRAEKSREFGIREAQTKVYQDAATEARNNARNQAPQTMQDDEGKVWQWDTGGKTWVPANGPDGKQITKATANGPKFNPEQQAYTEWSAKPENKGKTIIDFERDYQSAIHPKQFQINTGGGGKSDAQVEHSYEFHTKQFDTIQTPVDQMLMRTGRLRETLRQASPQADALAAPELLTVMAGGPGSGLRMNEAEISRIVGGRSVWQTLKADMNKFSVDPQHANSLTPEQRGQMSMLLDAVERKLTAKQAALNAGRDQLSQSTDPKEHRRIYTTTRQKLNQIDANDTPNAASAAGGGAGSGDADYVYDPISHTVKPK